MCLLALIQRQRQKKLQLQLQFALVAAKVREGLRGEHTCTNRYYTVLTHRSLTINLSNCIKKRIRRRCLFICYLVNIIIILISTIIM